MEDFGGAFDDDLFEKATKRSNKTTETFSTKLYNPLWFEVEAAEEQVEEAKRRLECSANWHYHSNNYSRALQLYLQAADLTKIQTREVKEAIARCHTQLGHRPHALQALHEIQKEAKSLDQVTAFLNLSTFIYKHFAMLYEAVLSLQKLCVMHSCEPTLWFSLADTYGALTRFQSQEAFVSSESDEKRSLHYRNSKRDKRGEGILKATHGVNVGRENNDKDITAKQDGTESTCCSKGYGQTKQENQCSWRTDLENKVEHLQSLPETHFEEAETVGDKKSNPAPRYGSISTLLCCQLTCLHKTLVVLKNVERNLLAFAVDKNKSLKEKVLKQIEDLPLTEDVKCQCMEAVDAASRDGESERDDKQILSMLPNAEEIFEERWFTWMREKQT